MYISPISERMRKRKAFADTELEGASVPHLFASSIASSSSVSNLTPSYSRLSLLTLPPNDYQALHQSAMSCENDATEYLPTTTAAAAAAAMSDYQLSEFLHSKSPSSSSLSLSPPLPPPLPQHFPSLPPQQHNIRIIDDAKLMYMRRQTNEPSLICSQLTTEQRNTACTVNAKPKLSFSIESIIGIK